MKYNLIKTENYLLVVDDSEIKEGDWIKWDNKVGRAIDTTYLPSTKKIISHLPLNGAPYLDGLDVLPPSWRDSGEDVDKLAREEILYNDVKREWWKQGYNKAREKYKYTEEHLRKAIDMYKGSVGVDNDGESCYSHLSTEQIIQSLQQPKYPIAFECETERVENNDVVFEDGSFNKPPYRYAPKTIINSEGRTEWVGKYIYE